jgi:hypothetical protein
MGPNSNSRGDISEDIEIAKVLGAQEGTAEAAFVEFESAGKALTGGSGDLVEMK